jgi:hypothetical protein
MYRKIPPGTPLYVTNHRNDFVLSEQPFYNPGKKVLTTAALKKFPGFEEMDEDTLETELGKIFNITEILKEWLKNINSYTIDNQLFVYLESETKQAKIDAINNTKTNAA